MNSSNRNKRTIWLVIATIALIAVTVLACIYRSRIQLGFGVLVDETGSKSMAAVAVVLGLFVLASLILWMVFPLLVFLRLKELTRCMSELNGTVRVCADQLARLENTAVTQKQDSRQPPSGGSSP